MEYGGKVPVVSDGPSFSLILLKVVRKIDISILCTTMKLFSHGNQILGPRLIPQVEILPCIVQWMSCNNSINDLFKG